MKGTIYLVDLGGKDKREEGEDKDEGEDKQEGEGDGGKEGWKMIDGIDGESIGGIFACFNANTGS